MVFTFLDLIGSSDIRVSRVFSPSSWLSSADESEGANLLELSWSIVSSSRLVPSLHFSSQVLLRLNLGLLLAVFVVSVSLKDVKVFCLLSASSCEVVCA